MSGRHSSPLLIIPARLGSTRVPFKNFLALAGRSPLARAIDVCLPIGIPVVTTDSTDVLPNTRWHLRHPHLATETASMVDVVVDVIQQIPGPPGQKILLVQPTQPLRTTAHLNRVLELLERHDSVATLSKTETAQKHYKLEAGRIAPVLRPVERGQDGIDTYLCDGTAYGFRRDWFLRHRSFRHPETYGLVIEPSETCPLDTPRDWLFAEWLLRRPGKETDPDSGSILSDYINVRNLP